MFILVIIAVISGFILISFFSSDKDNVEKPREYRAPKTDITLPAELSTQEGFFQACRGLIESMGLEISNERINDCEMEVIAHHAHELIGGMYVFNCWFAQDDLLIDVEQIKNLSSHVRAEQALKGIFITSGFFAEEVHHRLEGAAVECINRQRLIALLQSNTD